MERLHISQPLTSRAGPKMKCHMAFYQTLNAFSNQISNNIYITTKFQKKYRLLIESTTERNCILQYINYAL